MYSLGIAVPLRRIVAHASPEKARGYVNSGCILEGMNSKLTNLLLVLCLLGIGLILYYQQVYIPNRLGMCHDIAISLEKLQETSGDGMIEVSNEDLSSYMKGVLTCFIGR